MHRRATSVEDSGRARRTDPGADAPPAGVPRDDRVCERILRAADHHAALGVAHGAGEAELQEAKRRLARQVHPDKNSSPLATEAFRRLQAAYDVLAGPPRRRSIDVRGEKPQGRPAPQRHSGAKHGQEEGADCGCDCCGGGGFSSLMLSLLILAVVLLVSVGLVVLSGKLRRGRAQHGPSRSRERADLDVISQLTRSNANVRCGGHASSGGLCVVLVQSSLAGLYGQPKDRATERHASERAMLKEAQKEVALSMRTSRGEAIRTAWATVSVESGQWGSLLPQGHTLPWPVVLRASGGPGWRAGLQAAAMPLPPRGGGATRRLSEELPGFLQGVWSGEVASAPVRGNVSDLFLEPTRFSR